MFTWWQFVLVFVIVIFLLTFIYEKVTGFELEDFFIIVIPTSVIVFICYCVITFIGGLGTMWGYDEVETRYYYEAKENLLTLQDETESESKLSGSYMGVFAIGVGSVNSSTETEKYYHTMVGTTEEGYILNKYPCDDTYLFFDEEEVPYVQIKMMSYKCDYGKNWLFGGLLKPISNSERKDEAIKTELRVPKDTIKIAYEVNMK